MVYICLLTEEANMRALTIQHLAISDLKPNPRNARVHSKKQLHQIAASIREFGFNNPVLIDKDGQIIAGHGRVEAAKTCGLETVPVLRLEHLTAEQKRAFALGIGDIIDIAFGEEIVERLIQQPKQRDASNQADRRYRQDLKGLTQ
jgi:hypothetical protein